MPRYKISQAIQENLMCVECESEINHCDDCGGEFEDGEDIYCSYNEGDATHICKSCKKRINEEQKKAKEASK